MKQLLTVKELAERLKMSPSWVSEKARAHEIPHVKLGRCVRFREEDIEEFLNQHHEPGRY